MYGSGSGDLEAEALKATPVQFCANYVERFATSWRFRARNKQLYGTNKSGSSKLLDLQNGLLSTLLCDTAKLLDTHKKRLHSPHPLLDIRFIRQMPTPE